MTPLRWPSVVVAGLALAQLLPVSAGFAADRDPSAFSGRALAVVETILKHHPEAPARQGLILGGLRSAMDEAKLAEPPGLAARVSAISAPDGFAAILAELMPKETSADPDIRPVEDAFFRGMFANVPGGAVLMEAKEARVAEQMAGNRYVGIQVALSLETDGVKFLQIFPGGPADRAGIKTGDVLEAVEGDSIVGKPLRKVIDLLRGAEGTELTVSVRTPGEKEARTRRLTRLAMPHPTITGHGPAPADVWLGSSEDDHRVAYLKFDEILASTPHELRTLARSLENQGAKSLVLDLRNGQQAQFHPTLLIADSLLERGKIGRSRTTDRETTYEADADALLPGLPMAVLVGEETTGAAEWLAAALQDNHRAVIVGRPTRGFGAIKTTVPVGETGDSLTLTTGELERGDGRPIGPKLWPVVANVEYLGRPTPRALRRRRSGRNSASSPTCSPRRTTRPPMAIATSRPS